MSSEPVIVHDPMFESKTETSDAAETKHQAKARPKSVPAKPKTAKSKSKTTKKSKSTKTKSTKTKSTKTKTTRSKSTGSAKATKQPKRTPKERKTALEISGICIGPARVRAVLTSVALNPAEHAALETILTAENKPVKPKPNKSDANPETPVQGPQVHLKDLPKSVNQIIKQAEDYHNAALHEAYEKEHVKSYPDAKREDYLKKKREAFKADHNLNLGKFNTSFEKDFYKGLKEYVANHDNYIVGKTYDQKNNKSGVGASKEEKTLEHTEWTRAYALVNKMTVRLSNYARYIISSFLDHLVEQYALNGINNCLAEDRRIVHLKHALNSTSKSFNKDVPAHRFVQTFDSYASGLNWVRQCEEARRKYREDKKAAEASGAPTGKKSKSKSKFVYPDYPKRDNKFNFDTYVNSICISVKNRLASEAKTQEEHDRYLNVAIGNYFKTFCSYMVYEAIVRVGFCLKESVERAGVKTISDSMVYYALKQIHNVCGLNFTPLCKSINERIAKFETWKEERRKQREEDAKQNAEHESEHDSEVESEVEVEVEVTTTKA